MLRRISQTQWVVIAMMVGVGVGAAFPDRVATSTFHATDLAVLSSVFLRMIKSLIVPLLFSMLVLGIAGHGDDIKQVGTLALRSMVYFEVVTTLALVVGLAAVNIVKPGVGVDLVARGGDAHFAVVSAPMGLPALLEHIVPQSFFDAAARNDALEVTFFAIVFGIALARVEGRAKTFMLGLCESVSKVMFAFVGIVMKFAPIGIGAAIAVTVGKSGLGVLRNLGGLVLTLYATLAVFALFVLLPIAVACNVPVRRFVQAVKEPWLIAFSTASSEAALPRALENMVSLGVPRRIASFVLPTGYAFNMDGTTLYLAMASVFVAQAAGVDLSLSQQVVMMLTLMLTSKGMAAVPRASLVVLSAALAQFGLPLEGIAVILGVDALMDMARTSLNVLGNCLATVVMARWDGSFGAPDEHVAAASTSAARRLPIPVVATTADVPQR